MEQEVEIVLPKVFGRILPLPLGNVGIEHAPLDGRFIQAVLAEVFKDATTYSSLHSVVLTKRPKVVISQLEKWLEGTKTKYKRTDNGYKIVETGSRIQICRAEELDPYDLPFSRMHRLVLGECHELAQSILKLLYRMARQTICVGEFQERDNWFYEWCRTDPVSLIRIPASEIVQSFPEQKFFLADYESVYTEDEKKRYLQLEDIEVTTKRRTPYIKWVEQFMPQYCNLAFSQMHLEMGENIFAKMASKRRCKEVVIGPRDSAKSTHGAEAFPLYAICENIEKYILICADTTGQALKHLEVIKEELSTNEALAERYPAVCGEGSVWTNDSIITRNGIRVEALGAGKKIRGRRYKNHRPTLIVGDDLEGDEAAYSSKTREHRRNWFQKGVMKAGSSNHTNFLILGSNIHPDCLVATISRSPGWNAHLYKSIVSWPNRMDMWAEWERVLRDPTIEKPVAAARLYYELHRSEMDEGAVVLWPEREDLFTLMLMRATDGHAAFEAEKQNNPIDPSMCEWAPHLFDDRWFKDWPKKLNVVVAALDPSKGRKDKTGDYQGMVAVGIEITDKKDINIYVDADIQRRPMTEMCQRYAQFLSNSGAMIGVCESEQFQELLLPEIENCALQELLPCSIEPIVTEGVNKNIRIRRCGPWINRGRIRFRQGSPGVQLLIKQLSEFPNGDHDDGPDALEMALRRALEALSITVDDLVQNPY